ncbi:MAG: hypothetical protein A3G52_01055 [Candidatus Taylorbacteria bacterium RIFCSPLOWO2_12_FULL_43_20]|uniref:Glycosyl transferase family 1 domain-containing protein n=1 Tax=Candidatus Taylorbacteria bacterium RIFCSPLOWO2_12_FULL_43_20 TaxID=1802332 RepID=A0A1G2P3I6_9BACT|nr:MAG: hypothetical protein A3H58_00355 [Candidatus Taylorbacteria bacterium RIFCSPLOWO2_02_FULL_43_22b]OHA42843.1 MAG: hypothetical protein A3G52_01055 [Candidatus Taylorbacteria bacterium RIFCSPLOWO2_12_FULL_43_20]
MKKSKKVIIFSLAYLPRFIGGAEIAVKEITSRISGDDVEFDMITARLDSADPVFERVGNVNVYRVGVSKHNPTSRELAGFPLYLNKVFFPILAFVKAVQLHRKRPFDSIWAMMSYMGFPALFLKFFYPKIRFVLTLQDGDSPEHIIGRKRIKAVSFLYNKIFRTADAIQAISGFLADFARARGARCPVWTIPNGVDTSKFKAQISKLKSDEIRKNFGIRQNDISLVTSSRLVAKNGVEDIIDAMKFLDENIKLMIAGSGELENELKEKTAKLGLSGRVFFAGYVDHDDLPAYLNASDIFIRPSLSEGMGNSFIEAMAAGVPVIATPVGGIPDFLHDGETGIFCEVKNPRSVAEKVNMIITDPELRARLIRNGEKLARDKYNWSDISVQIRSLL